MSQRSERNHRNNPYMLDRAFVQMHHSAAGVIWRFRAESAAMVTGTAGAWELVRAVTLTWAPVVITASATLLTAMPWTRRFLIRRFWCVLSRHRIQRVCYETRLHTRSGRADPVIFGVEPAQIPP